MNENKLLSSKNILTSSIILNSNEINYNNDQIINIIKDKLKKKIGDKCSKEGYIIKDSIEILEISMGKLITSVLNGSTKFDVRFTCNLCYPKINQIIIADVESSNKLGISCKIQMLQIVIPKHHHLDKKKDETIEQRNKILELFDTLKSNDKVKIKILGSRFELNDNKIFVIGELLEQI
jgi:DNA-directed RNA polymerase subunit E'/Rpb7